MSTQDGSETTDGGRPCERCASTTERHHPWCIARRCVESGLPVSPSQPGCADHPGARCVHEADYERDLLAGGEVRCAVCQGRVEYLDPTGDGIASWWAHENHPWDHHDAAPARTRS